MENLRLVEREVILQSKKYDNVVLLALAFVEQDEEGWKVTFVLGGETTKFKGIFERHVWPDVLENEEEALINARAAVMAAFVSAVVNPELCLYMLYSLEAIEEDQVDLTEGELNILEIHVNQEESPFEDFINNDLIM
ncbi:MAG: hypothetical protein WC196_05650 [Bacilli bacterium]|jgi:hypothetical protein